MASIDKGRVALRFIDNYSSSEQYNELDVIKYDNILYIAKESVQGELPQLSDKFEVFVSDIPDVIPKASIVYMDKEGVIQIVSPQHELLHRFKDDGSDGVESSFSRYRKQLLMIDDEIDSSAEYNKRIIRPNYVNECIIGENNIDVSPSLSKQKHEYGCGVAGIPTKPNEKILTTSDLITGSLWQSNGGITEPVYTCSTTGTHGQILKTDNGIFLVNGNHSDNHTQMGTGYSWSGSTPVYRPNIAFVPDSFKDIGVKKWMMNHNASFFLLNNGEVWSAGRNSNGYVGHGINADNTAGVFSKIKGSIEGLEIIDIETGCFNGLHAVVLALDSSYKLHAWGENYAYGTSYTDYDWSDNITTPRPVNSAEKFVAIYSIGGYTGGACFAISDKGWIHAWGGGMFGVLGNNSGTERNATVANVHSFLPAPYDTMRCIGIVGNGGYVAAVGCPTTVAFILEDHSVWTTGYGGFGARGDHVTNTTGTHTSANPFYRITELGDINNEPYVTKIYAGGEDYTKFFAIMNDYTVYTFGYAAYGDGASNTSSLSIVKNLTHENMKLGNPYVTDIIDICTVGYGANPVTYFLKADGSLLSFGRNNAGQLGLGHTAENTVHTSANSTYLTLRSIKDYYDVEIGENFSLNGSLHTLNRDTRAAFPVYLNDERIVGFINTGHSSNARIGCVTESGQILVAGDHNNYDGSSVNSYNLQYVKLDY